MRTTHAATLLSLAILAGCSAQPKALYQSPPANGSSIGNQKYEGDWEGLPKFTLAKSQLVFDYGDKEKKANPQMVSVPAEAEPHPDTPTRFAIRQDDPWGVDTHLKVTKLDNTDLLASIGTEVEDKRVKYIETAGAVAVGLLGAVALTGTDKELPLSIDSYQLLRAANVKRDKGVAYGKVTAPDGNTSYKFTASIGPVKPDALDTSTYSAKANETAQETIIHSACRSITVTFSDGPLGGQQFSASIADPRFVQTVKYPEKGSIEFHTACGANTTSSASGASSSLDILNALIAQSKTVREAWKTATTTKGDVENAAAAFDKAQAPSQQN
ncbi:hypothetical protein OD781_08795 [Pseudomonas aeruginosa]|jgi:hypothetical protein|nr:hypothetical protein [Pseudomonas aeruginosa]MCV4061230.1 hypothetical protein [Pseudomonas aeruginosa]MCV4077285.1 hypothetical protein [Pseudomonas aeruginosa]MCV4148644.1 hypothetical protein [Pseudomonas aeruginosa]MCV4180553.1 hypothetical protein [Pseudomonas aeruginosa]MCV4220016.1 hypothetical protein [Pseudomonas aeruginosa]